MFKKTLLLIIVQGWIYFSATAQYNFSGSVVNQQQQPLAGVSVSVLDSLVSLTDSNGRFSFTHPEQQIVIQFSFSGLESTRLTAMHDQVLNVRLYQNQVTLEEALIKAYERNSKLSDAPVAVALLARNDLERYDNSSILPAVNTIAGVKMDERSPGSYRLSIRGNLLRSPFGVRNVKVYWNGIPFTDANGNTYLNQIDFNNIGSIELIKGPGGSMYGAGTGGVVLLNGRVATSNEKHLELNTVAGSYGTYQQNIAYKQGSARSNSVLQFSHQQSDGWRNHTNMRRDVANYTASFILSDKHTIHGNIFYSDLYYQTPGGLTAAQLAANPRQSRPAGAFGSAADQQAALFIKTFYAGLASDYKLNAYWSNTTSIYTSATRFKNPAILNYQRKTEQGIGGRSVNRYQRGIINLVAGGEYQYGFVSSRTFGNKAGVPDTLQFDDEIAATQFNLFVQADATISKGITFSAGLSYNNYRYGFTRLNVLPVNETGKTFDPVLVPMISLAWKPGNDYSVYANVSKGFSPPTIDEIVPSTGVFNPGLAAEKATNYEIGFRAAPVKNKLFIDLSYYILQLGNTIVTRRDNSGADFFVNTGNTRQKGLEVAISYYPVRNQQQFLTELKTWITYTMQHARFITYQQGNNDFSGNKLTGTAGNVMVAGIDALTRMGVYANCTYSFTDAIPLNDANTFFGNAYHLLFARAGYKTTIGRKLAVECYGSYNKSFNLPFGLGNDLNAAGNRFFNPSAPENLAAGLKLNISL